MAPADDRALALGRLLRGHRAAAGMSQQALAEAAGTSTRLVSNLERGVGGLPRPGTLAALADALGLAGAPRAEFLRGGVGTGRPAGRLPFGDLLRSLRERAGLTQDELAARALVSSRTVSDLERGVNRSPRRDTATLMARTLGLTGSVLADFEIAVASGAEFARIRSGRTAQDATAGAVPKPASALIGRADDVAAVRSGLSDGAIVTVVGTAGVGKTRLAIDVAADLSAAGRRVLFVPLSSARTVIDVVQVLAVAIDVSVDDVVGSGVAVAPEYEHAALCAIADALGPSPCALVLDNLEQVTDARRVVATLAARAPHCALLTTSRTALGIEGERLVPLAPLAVPDADGDAQRSPAVQLFIDRAAAAAPRWQPEPELADIAALCRALDGLPLALVLAGPAVRTKRVREIAADITSVSPIDLGAVGLPYRHRSLRAALAWSFSLLDDEARTVLGRLSVFPGAVDLETADLVCGSGGLDVAHAIRTLLAANLLIPMQDRSGEPMVRMLNAVAQFAKQRLLESGEAASVARTHAQVMVRIAETAAPHLVGPDQGPWQERLTRHIDSFRSTLDWLIAADELPLAARLASALWRYWYLAGQLREGRERTAAVLSRVEGTADLDAAIADLCYGLGVLAYMSGDVPVAREHWLRSRADYAQLGVVEGVANSDNNLGMSYLYAGDLATARAHYELAHAAAQQSGADRPMAVTLGNLAKLAVDEGNPGEATRLAERALELFRRLGDVRAEADLSGLLAEIAAATGDIDTARLRWAQALADFEELADPTGIGPVLVALAELDLSFGDHDLARARLDRALEIATDADDPWTSAQATLALAQLHAAGGDRGGALVLLDRAEALSEQCQHEDVRSRVQDLRHDLANG